MYIKDDSRMRNALVKNGLTTEDVEFVLGNIKESKLDEDFKIIHQNVYRLMLERGIWDAFEKSCLDLGIVLTRRNEPER